MSNKPIFFDESGRRAARIRVLAWAVGLSVLLILVGFVTSLALSPRVNGLDFPGRAAITNPAQLEKRAQKPGLLARAERLAQAARKRRLEDIARLHRAQGSLPNRVLPAILKPQAGRPLAIGFYTNWAGVDDAAWPSLKRSLKNLDWVVPSWMELERSRSGVRHQAGSARAGFHPRQQARRRHPADDPECIQRQLRRPGLARLLADRGRADKLLDQIIAFVAANKLQGVTIDFEEVPKGAHKDLEDFLSRMSAAFAPHDWIIAQAAPFDDDDWPYQTYANIVDYTMLMAYDQVDDQGRPVRSPARTGTKRRWTRACASFRPIPPSLSSVPGPMTGPARSGATVKSFEDTMAMARDDGATLLFDPASNNPHFNYEDDDGTKHQVWFLDGVTAFNQIHAADPYRPAGYALWRLGLEDPSILPLMGRPYDSPAPDSLKHIPNNIENPDYDGEGEILRVEADPAVGERTLTIEASTGDIVDERYDSLPTSYVIRKVGQVPGKLALTFDDGPDPEWTPAILDILKQKKVPAAFFMIGSNMEAHPGLVQRVLAEGHEIGNHTYTHPNLADTPPAAVRLELNATQRLFQALTGRSMRFFRSPYLTDANPSDADEIEPIEQAQALGYIEVTANLDTLDWEQLSVHQMMKLVFKALNNPNPDLRGNVVLMHDSGGDRSKTLVLLPKLIDALRAKGYTFVPLSELAGFKRDDVMPRLPFSISLYADRAVFLTISYVSQFLYYCFLGAIVLGAGAAVRAGRPGAVEADQGIGRCRCPQRRRAAGGDGADPGLQ